MSLNLPDTTDAFGLLLEIISSISEIKALEFATLDFAPLMDARGPMSDVDTFVMARALEFRDSLKLPFWDGVMLAGSHSDTVPSVALKAAVFHQKLGGKTEWIPVNGLTRSLLHSMSQKATSERRLLAVTSAVRMIDGGVKHLPLLDFHIRFSEYATELIKEVIPLLGVSGALLKSGKSYHFYGDSLITYQELLGLLGKALLFSPIVDRAWIGHQLIEGCCALRISSREEYGDMPVFISQVG